MIQKSLKNKSFNFLVERFLGRQLPGELADKISFPDLSTEAQGVILRMLALMERASYPATEFNPLMIHLLATVTPAMLPSAWGGRIPPVTWQGRHRKLDAYVTRQTWTSSNGQPVYVDLGCGFPPVTTADTARYLPDWSVFGVDRSFARYVLYDAEGHYACFNHEGEFEYLQQHRKPLHDNPNAAQSRFRSLFADLYPQLKGGDDKAGETADKDGNRLVCNPIREFKADNLEFIESDIEALRLPPVRVIRCMNVLLYFEKSVRERMRLSMDALLDDGGISICGFNHPFGTYARYTVYKKDATGVSPVEFAFSPDNLRPLGVGPWLTINDEDEQAELLADLTGAIRNDRIFWTDFNRCVDASLEKLGICRRGNDGFNHFTTEAQTAPPTALMEKTTELWRQMEAAGYTDGAVEALGRAGCKAWKNPVGDIAVLPPD
jgi:hypothetical protein